MAGSIDALELEALELRLPHACAVPAGSRLQGCTGTTNHIRFAWEEQNYFSRFVS